MKSYNLYVGTKQIYVRCQSELVLPNNVSGVGEHDVDVKKDAGNHISVTSDGRPCR